jgi:murein DD-endopeptidase MepM/ murein hydrolase activator NlpD
VSFSGVTIKPKLTDVGAGFMPALVSFLIFALAFLSSAFSQASGSPADWQNFERGVRDGTVSYQEGEKLIAEWADRLEREFSPEGFRKAIFFPLRGYSVRDVGGKHGDGYKPAGYRFLDGNRHRGHPAQDIFVRDRDQDGIDDLTAKPVEVLTLADGIVLSTFSEWKETDQSREIRGGNYVWIYHPALKAFSYYAHLEKVLVGPGDRVYGGSTVATLGRTGKSASLQRSPTHLHFMILSAATMAPMDPFPLLESSRLRGSSLLALELCSGVLQAFCLDRSRSKCKQSISLEEGSTLGSSCLTCGIRFNKVRST